MQFVFGNDGSKYDILYSDVDKQDALDLYNNKLKLPFSSDVYDVYGYINLREDNKGLFFKSFVDNLSDTEKKYCIHCVERESDAKFFESEYLKSMFLKFVTSDNVEAIRKDEINFAIGEEFDESLVGMSDDTIIVNHEILKAVIAKLYQRKHVMIAIDDDLFVKDSVLLLLKKIFSYLTPSLRSETNYLIGMANAGYFDDSISLKIVPQSMLFDEQYEYIDLYEESYLCNEDEKYSELAEFLITGDKQLVNDFLNVYEDICKSLKTPYNSERFIEFFDAIKGNTVESYDRLLDCYIADYNYDSKEPVPPLFITALADYYSVPDNISEKVDFSLFRLGSFDEFFDKNYVTIEKVYLLLAGNIGLITDKISKKLSSLSISKKTYLVILDEISRYEDIEDKTESMPASYKIIKNCIDNGVVLLKERLEKFNECEVAITAKVHVDIVKGNLDESLLDNTKVCCEYFKKQLSSLVADASANNIVVDELIYDIVNDEINLYNKTKQIEIDNLIREKNEKKNSDELNKVFNKHTELYGFLRDSNIDGFKAAIKEVDSYPEKYITLFASFYAEYIIIMCRKLGLSKVFSKRNISVLTNANEKSNPHLYECIKEKLLITNPDIAFLFITKYASSINGAVKQIVFSVLNNSSKLDLMSPDIFRGCCEIISQLIHNRVVDGESFSVDQSDPDYARIAHSVKNIDSQSNSMMILAEVGAYVPFDVNYSKGINKSVVIVTIVSVVALIVTILCLVFFLTQSPDSGDDLDDDTDEDTGYTQTISPDGNENSSSEENSTTKPSSTSVNTENSSTPEQTPESTPEQTPLPSDDSSDGNTEDDGSNSGTTDDVPTDDGNDSGTTGDDTTDSGNDNGTTDDGTTDSGSDSGATDDGTTDSGSDSGTTDDGTTDSGSDGGTTDGGTTDNEGDSATDNNDTGTDSGTNSDNNITQ